MAKHHPDLIMCRKQPGIAIGRLCEKCDGKCVICDSYVRPCTLVRVCDECNYGSFQGRCVICGGVGISDAYYCKECTQQEKDRDGCPKIVNLGSAKTDLFYERKKYGFKKRWSRRGSTNLLGYIGCMLCYVALILRVVYCWGSSFLFTFIIWQHLMCFVITSWTVWAKYFRSGIMRFVFDVNGCGSTKNLALWHASPLLAYTTNCISCSDDLLCVASEQKDIGVRVVGEPA